MKVGIKHILLCVIMVFLYLPILQDNFNLSKIRLLAGDYVPVKDIAITRNTWFNKIFQEKKEKFLHDHFGYHNSYIRLHNQIAFELFNKANANGVVIGKENYLYEGKYIEAYYGKDFIGINSIRKKMKMASFLADTFKKMNKTFLLIFEPGKGAYFPDYFPENKKTKKSLTNIEEYLRFAKEMKIPHIDFHSWFIQQKNKSKYPLVPKYGIHWSQYGAMLATDSILKTIELMRNIDIPDIYCNKFTIEKAKDTDIDIENGMNLLFRFKPELMMYPDVLFEDSIGKTKPSVLVVADSYYWQIFAIGISCIFDRSDFWYYFKTAHSPRFDRTKIMKNINIPDEIVKHDVIIIMSTDIHLPEFGWNFIETMFGYYHGTIPREKLDPDYFSSIIEMKEQIRKDQNRMKNIVKKAAINKIPIDSMLYLDAKWFIDEKEKK